MSNETQIRAAGILAAMAALVAPQTETGRYTIRGPRGNKYATGHATGTPTVKPAPARNRSADDSTAIGCRDINASYNRTLPGYGKACVKLKKIRRAVRGSVTDRSGSASRRNGRVRGLLFT